MPGVGPLYETHRLAIAAQLAAIRAAHGAAYAGVVAEAVMAAVSDFVRQGEGPEAAFNTLTRHADAVIAPTVERAARGARPDHRQHGGRR